MKQGIICVLAVFLLLSLALPSVSALTVLNVFVDSSGDALFLGETDEEIVVPVGVSLSDGEITGITSALTSKQGELWTFSYTLANAEVTVVLPPGAVIKELSGGEIFLDGDQIAVFFQEEVVIEYTVEEVSGDGSVRPSANVPLIVALFAVLIVLVVFLINYANREQKDQEELKKKEERIKKLQQSKKQVRSKKQDQLEIIKQVLSDREKSILEKLKETGKIKSSYVRRMLDIPKASFSRHLQELEKKGLIKRTGEGKNKFVELVKK